MIGIIPIGIRNSAAVIGGSSLPDRSLSFTAASSQYLSLSNSNFGSYDHAKWAFSCWFKRAGTGSGTWTILSQYGGSGNRAFRIKFSDDQISIQTYSNGTAVAGTLLTTATYANTSWHHLLFHYDSANATSGDRMRLWIDGSEVTAFDADVAPSSGVYSSTCPVEIAAIDNGGTATNFWDGLIYQPAFFSGALPNISSVYNAGAALDQHGATGIWSLLNSMNSGTLEDDDVITANWTNNGTVIYSTTIP